MGCDIHAHFEIKVNGEWVHYSKPNIKRNYRLFTKMAGVRDTKDVYPISPPKGLPGDISKVTALENKWWGNDGYSHSWLDKNEIREVIRWHKQISEPFWMVSYEQWGYLHGNTWDYFDEYREDYPDEIEDIRLVFWFDS